MSAIETSASRILLAGQTEALARLGPVLQGFPWSCTAVRSPVEVLRRMRDDRQIDVVLMMPYDPVDAFAELCRSIKLDERSRLVAVICVLSSGQNDRIIDFYSCGADDCIGSWVSDQEILLRLQKAIRFKHATDTLEDAGAVLTSLANAIEGKDHYTCGHVDRVGTYAGEIGRRMGLDPDSMATMKLGGVVHDIGKVGVPDHILNKPGRLTDEELIIMRRHPVIGYDILKPLRTFQNVLPIVRWHHERPDGKGYPDGLKDTQIPLLARIVAVADVLDALSTDRPYRPAMPMAQCREILSKGGDQGELDPLVVQILLKILDDRTLPGVDAVPLTVQGPAPAVV
jgi:putative two-component system response regulator